MNCFFILFTGVLENDSVCAMNFISSSLTLIGREDQSAMVIKDSRYLQHWTGKHEFNCRFSVTSSLGFGVFAVIQHMSLRRNAQGQCIDFVQVCYFLLLYIYILF